MVMALPARETVAVAGGEARGFAVDGFAVVGDGGHCVRCLGVGETGETGGEEGGEEGGAGEVHSEAMLRLISRTSFC